MIKTVPDLVVQKTNPYRSVCLLVQGGEKEKLATAFQIAALPAIARQTG